jgi:hypothetical protein
MPELITIPISFFEYAADFEHPVFALWKDRTKVVEAMFDALKPWNPNIDNVEVITTGKHSEQGVNFKLPEKRVAFFFGPLNCKFTKDTADWSSAQETINILDTARSTLIKLSGAVVSVQKIALAMHLQPKTKSFVDILRPFVSPQVVGLHEEKLTTAATIVKWEKNKLILDGSGSIANGVFLRLEGEFDDKATFEEIALALKKDEDAAFKMLDVAEDLS